MKKLISVVMPVYNAENYLEESIQSILNQTYSNFEFIIINDGSTDKSLEIINKYQKIDDRIILISRENKGIVESLNEGIRKSNGEYIARMDADDISMPKRFEEQMKIMTTDNEIIVCGSWIETFGFGYSNKVIKYFSKDEQIKANLLFNCCLAQPSVIIRKNVFLINNISYDKSFIYTEDYNLWIELAKYGKFYNIPEVLLKYRIVKSGATSTANKNEEQRKEMHIRIWKKSFCLIDYKISNKESELLFKIFNKVIIKKYNIDIVELNKFFDNIIEANIKTSFSNSFALKQVLGNRWLLIFLIKRDLSQIFSKYFLYGILSVLNNALFKK